MIFTFFSVLFSGILLLFFYLKYFEKRGIYYPTFTIQFTPFHVGLEYEEVFFPTPEGINLHGWFVKGNNRDMVVLFCHGNAGNIGDRIEIIKMFVDMGLDVFIFDYRGYGKSEGRPSEKGLYIDAQSAYNYLVHTKNIPPQKVIIYGKSIGANVAVDLASRLQEGLLICDSGFTSALDMGKTIFPYLPPFLLKAAISVKFDALNKIKRVKIPKLIIHSRDDEIIPFSQAEKLFKYASSPKEFWILKGSHNEAIFLNSQEFMRRVKKFIEKYKPLF